MLWKLNLTDKELLELIKKYVLSINKLDLNILEKSCAKHEILLQKTKLNYFNYDFLRDKRISELVLSKVKEDEYINSIQKSSENEHLITNSNNIKIVKYKFGQSQSKPIIKDSDMSKSILRTVDSKYQKYISNASNINILGTSKKVNEQSKKKLKHIRSTSSSIFNSKSSTEAKSVYHSVCSKKVCNILDQWKITNTESEYSYNTGNWNIPLLSKNNYKDNQ